MFLLFFGTFIFKVGMKRKVIFFQEQNQELNESFWFAILSHPHSSKHIIREET